MLLKEFFAEIESTFALYQETGDIDRVSIKTWVISCLRQFGKNICEKREAILEVKNSQAKLPETFKSLILALDLTPAGYKIHGDVNKVKDSFIYRERIEQSGFFDWTSQTFYDDCSAKKITETMVIDNDKLDLYYSPNYLSVVKGFKKDSFDVDCINLHPSIREACPNQISINKSTMQTNFKEGRVYIQYWGLPLSEEDGEVEIPEITTGDILLFITNHVKIQIAENLILNNKNPNSGLQSLLSLWMQQVIPLRNAAKSEASFNGLPKNWDKIYNLRLQVDTAKYNLPRF